MKDQAKTKEQLIGELAELRRQIAELEASETEPEQADEALDDEPNHSAFNLNILLLATFVVILLGTIAMLLQIGKRSLSYMLSNTTFLIFATLILAVCYYLSRKGHVRAGSIIFTVMMTIACGGAIIVGGTCGALPVILIIPVVSASVTLGTTTSLALAALSVATLVTIGLLERNSIIKVAYPAPEAMALLNMFDVGFALFFVALGIWLAGYSLRQSLERARKEITERKRVEEALQESEERYRLIAENVTDVIWAADMNFRFTHVSPSVEHLRGYSAEEVMAQSLSDVLTPASLVRATKILEEERENIERGTTVQPKTVEFEFKCKDGSTVQTESTVSVLYDENKVPVGILGSTRDITERKQVEDMLRHSEALLNVTQRLAKVGGWEWNVDQQTIFWTDETYRIYGFDPNKTKGSLTKYIQRSVECYDPDDRPVIAEAFVKCTQQGKAYDLEFPFTTIQGHRKWIRTTAQTERKEGKIVRVIGNIVDITERKQAEARVHRLLNQQLVVNKLALALGHLTDLDQIYSTIHEMVQTLVDADGFIVSHYDREEHLIHTEYVFIHGTVQDVTNFPSILMGKEGKGLQSQVIRKGEPLYIPDFSETRKHIQTQYTIQLDGSVTRTTEDEAPITNSALLVPMRISGETVGVMQVHSLRLDAYSQEDIDLVSSLANMAAIAIQNARLLQQTREQAQRVQQIINTVPEGVLLLDANGRVMLINPVANTSLVVLTGAKVGDTLTHLGDRPLAEFLTSPPAGLWHEIVIDDKVFELIARPMGNGPEPEDWVLVINDVTQQREIQQRIQHQERLAAVGQLAAGIAHDFNNIMATIVLYAQMTARMEELSAVVQERMETINQQAGHATKLISQILDFSRRAMLERRPLDIVHLLKEHVKLLKRTLPESIKIELVYESDESAAPLTVHADPTRMQQMVTNLAVNARDAMPNGGTLRIGLERVEVRPGESPLLPEMEPGDWVQVIVSDTGTGIPPDVLPHIFEPFFTTRAPLGSGLGLAQVHGIVGQHGGRIDVDTQLGEGTTFTIYIPALSIPEKPSTVSSRSSSPLSGQGQTVLVVEDDAVLRKALVESLETLNYQVLEAKNGREALAVLEQSSDKIDLLLSDVVMPEMGGKALLYALRERGLTIPVVMLTGHPLKKEMEELRAQEMADWLSKPPELEELAEVVARALDMD